MVVLSVLLLGFWQADWGNALPSRSHMRKVDAPCDYFLQNKRYIKCFFWTRRASLFNLTESSALSTTTAPQASGVLLSLAILNSRKAECPTSVG